MINGRKKFSKIFKFSKYRGKYIELQLVKFRSFLLIHSLILHLFNPDLPATLFTLQIVSMDNFAHPQDLEAYGVGYSYDDAPCVVCHSLQEGFFAFKKFIAFVLCSGPLPQVTTSFS